jgi:hypothetical protein
MTILRRHHNSNFTIVPNTIFEDKRISVEAIGTLGYLLSRPPNWAVHLAQIGRTLRMGRDKTERVFQELKGAGYVIRRRQRRIGGRWGPAEFLVLDDPRSASALDAEPPTMAAFAPQLADAAPCPEKPSTADPSTGQPHADIPGTYKGLRDNKTESNKTLVGDDARAGETFQISSEACAFADELASICGYDLKFLPLSWVSAGPAMYVQIMLDRGWQIAVMRDAARAVVGRKKDGPPVSIRYFEKIFDRAHKPQFPLAAGQLSREREASDGQATQSRSTAGWRTSRDAFRAAHAKLKATNRDATATEAHGGTIVRFVAPSGRG